MRWAEVAWADLYPFARKVLGYPQLIPFSDLSGWRYVRRTLPMPYSAFQAPPDSFGSYTTFLWAQDVPEWHGVGKQSIDQATGIATYPRARLKIVFRTRTFEVLDDGFCAPVPGSGSPMEPFGYPDEANLARFVTRLSRPAGKLDILPLGTMRYIDGSANGMPLRYGLPLNVPLSDVTYIHHDLPYVNYKAITACVNGINDIAFDGGRYDAQTLLCQQPDIKPYFSPLGVRLYTIHFRFRWRPNIDSGGVARGWNYVYTRKADGTLDYVPVSSNGLNTGTKPYRLVSFSKLFRPDQLV